MRFRYFFENTRPMLSTALPFIEEILKDPDDETNLRVLSDWLQDTSDPILNEMGELLSRLISDQVGDDEKQTIAIAVRRLQSRADNQLVRLHSLGGLQEISHHRYGHYAFLAKWKDKGIIRLIAEEGYSVSVSLSGNRIPVMEFVQMHPEVELPFLHWLVASILSLEEIMHSNEISSRSQRIILSRLKGMVASSFENMALFIQTGPQIIELFRQAKKNGIPDRQLDIVREDIQRRARAALANPRDFGYDQGIHNVLRTLYLGRLFK